jgi:hypothetical protein
VREVGGERGGGGREGGAEGRNDPNHICTYESMKKEKKSKKKKGKENNHKALKKEIIENTRKWKDLP